MPIHGASVCPREQEQGLRVIADITALIMCHKLGNIIIRIAPGHGL